MEEKSAMQLKIQISGVKPPVWRRIIVPTTIRYDQLNVLIQLAFDWTNSHLHGFTVAHDRSLNYIPRGGEDDAFGNFRLTDEYMIYPDLTKGSVTYTYDFGDDWEHKIKLEKMLSIDELPSVQIPYCVGGRGDSILEDSRMMDEDGNGEPNNPFDKDDVNELFAEVITAGEALINIDGDMF